MGGQRFEFGTPGQGQGNPATADHAHGPSLASSRRGLIRGSAIRVWRCTIGAAMGHPATRLLHVSICAVVAATLAALSAPVSAALAASGRPAPYVVTLDPGVQGVNGLVEKDLTLNIARRVRDRLQKLGVQVVMTRNSDQYVDITPRIQAANSHNADLYVSIHLNYFGNDHSVGGSLVLYPNAASEAFARTMAATLGKQLGPIGIPGDGIQLRDNLWTTAQMPAITVECAYLSNLGEATLLKKSSTLDAIAGAMVKGMQAQDPQLTKRSAEIAARSEERRVGK